MLWPRTSNCLFNQISRQLQLYEQHLLHYKFWIVFTIFSDLNLWFKCFYFYLEYEKLDCSSPANEYKLSCNFKCKICNLTFILTDVENGKEIKYETRNESPSNFSFIEINNSCSSFQIYAFFSKIGLNMSEKMFIKNVIGTS